MNISAKELAKLINVSPATVSMVFNNKPGISDATRELVLKTAAEYGYAPKKNESSGASSRIIQLVNYKKHGKVAADTPFFSQLTEGISTECTRQGCALHISYFYETMDIDSQLDALRAVDCEGILLLATEMAPSDFRKFRDFSVPIVVVDCYYDELDYDCVLINNIQGAFNATNYLIQCGHREIAAIFKADDGQGHRRYAGYIEALMEADIRIKDERVVWIDTEDVRNRNMREESSWILRRIQGCTACVCYNDEVASSLAATCLEQKIKVPDKMSIIGIDDSDLANYCEIPLASVKNPIRELAKKAAEEILDLMQEKEVPDSVELKPEIINRSSVKIIK